MKKTHEGAVLYSSKEVVLCSGQGVHSNPATIQLFQKLKVFKKMNPTSVLN